MDTQKPNKLEVSGDMHVPKRTVGQRLGAVLLILVILGTGFFLARYLLTTKPKAKKKRPPKIQTLVKVQSVQRSDVRIIIEALGSVVPAKQVDLKPQVGGTVVSMNPNLQPGGLVQAGENLLVLDDRDYRLALAAAKAGFKKAEMDLKLEEGNQAVAKREYQLVQKMAPSAPPPAHKELALRGPQLEKVRAALEVAGVNLKKAQLDLDRTVIKAPFNAVVVNINGEIGALLSPQSTVVQLVGTDSFWVELSLPQNSLRWLDLGSTGNASVGPTLKLFTESGQHSGRIIRLLSGLEPNGLQARLLAEVQDPMGLVSGKPPLLLGAFVKAKIGGKELPGIFRLPRVSLLPGSNVLLASAENSLIIRKVKSVWQDSEWVYVTEGLVGGERLIVSPVASPVAGMPLNIAGSRLETKMKPEMRKPGMRKPGKGKPGMNKAKQRHEEK